MGCLGREWKRETPQENRWHINTKSLVVAKGKVISVISATTMLPDRTTPPLTYNYTDIQLQLLHRVIT